MRPKSPITDEETQRQIHILKAQLKNMLTIFSSIHERITNIEQEVFKKKPVFQAEKPSYSKYDNHNHTLNHTQKSNLEGGTRM